MRFTCDVVEFNKVNRNNRLYTRENIERALNQAQSRLLGHKMLGGLYEGSISPVEPISGKLAMSEASHIVTDLEISEDGSKLIGTIDLLDTPRGQKAQLIVNSGQASLCLRGSGIVGEDRTVNDYVLDGVDLVLQKDKA